MEKVAMWIGLFSVLLALFSMIIVVAKSSNMKPHFDAVNEVMGRLTIAVDKMSDYLKDVRMEDRAHQSQAERTHNELHSVATALVDVDYGVSSISEKASKISDIDNNVKIVLSNTNKLIGNI